MASSSIFIYELRSPAEINVESIYSRLKGYPEDENTYFNLEMISANELLGEYVIVQNAQESYYNPEQRVFEYRIVPKANVISFSITDDFLEIWGNKTSANKLVFELSNLLAPISINSVEVTIDTLLEKLKGYKLKVSKVCFQDFLFTEDIVGNFTVDLSSYGDAFSILQKYNDKISSMTIILYCDASEPTGRLSGISSAILKGDGLRNNDFVKECMSQGFIFSSMSYKLSHKTLPITIVIDVNFKQTDLKINIVKTYQLEDDGIERLAPLPASDQSLYIDYFQNVAYAVYSNLIEKQKTELVKQTIKPEK